MIRATEGGHGDRLFADRIGQEAPSDAPCEHHPRESRAHQAGVSAGLPGRALTRDPAKVLFDPKVGVVQADLAKPETLAKALSGVEPSHSRAHVSDDNPSRHDHLTLLIQKGSRPSVFTGMCTRRSHRSRSVTQGASG
jgi:hypothetical protein